MERGLLTTADFARMFGVTPSSVRRWVYEGKLIPDTRTPGGRMRWLPSTVTRLMEEWSDH